MYDVTPIKKEFGSLKLKQLHYNYDRKFAMHSIQISLSSLSLSKTQTLDFHSIGSGFSPCLLLQQKKKRLMMRRKKEEGLIITMSNRRKERRPLQRGRISTETIQAVQALKRAKNDPHLLHRIFDSKIRRLIKFDLIALLRELQRQNEPLLSLQVFEEIRKEYWYKPQVSVYADMVAVVASNGLFEKVHLLFSYLRAETLNADADAKAEAEGFNALLTTLMEFGIYEVAMECFQLMKEVGCEPDESTFRILINGFESKGEIDLSAIVRQEAEMYFGESLEFLLEKEEEAVSTGHTECLRTGLQWIMTGIAGDIKISLLASVSYTSDGHAPSQVKESPVLREHGYL